VTDSRDPLGDDISAVTLVDHMGHDIRVVNAARVSMAKESTWELELVDDATMPGDFPYYTNVLSERDVKLINYLAKHNHWTPFSHVMITLRIKMPIFIARQWFKHQVGFTRNEVSRRYVDDKPEFYMPEGWRKRAHTVKQGSSSETLPVSANLKLVIGDLAYGYQELIDSGVAPEMARMVLPQSMYTEFYETASLAAYARLIHLRSDPHAQQEIQLYANAVSELITKVAPVSVEAISTHI